MPELTDDTTQLTNTGPIQQAAVESQFEVVKVPFHLHNGVDSPQVDVKDLANYHFLILPTGFKGNFNASTPQSTVIKSGVLTPLNSYIFADTESGAATDDIDTIVNTNLPTGAILILKPFSNDRTIVMKDSTGNMQLAGDFSMDSSNDTITLIKGGSLWLEISRSDNSA